MTRIVAGTAKGRVLKVPAAGTRPTSERVREALFQRLEHWGLLDGARVLDLYAGSGALGLEALSRGASHATFVDKSRAATRILKENLSLTGLSGSVYTSDALSYLSQQCSDRNLGEQIDLVLVDPPYTLSEEVLTDVLTALVPCLTPDALVLVERSSRTPEPAWPAQLRAEDQRTWGETRIWFASPVLNDYSTSPSEE